MSWVSKLRNAIFARPLDDDLAEEMRDHLERRASQLRDQGMESAEAQRQAALIFGNRTQIRERSHDIRLWTGLEITLQDLRYAWRGLRKSPAMAATAILSLALAIGANTAIYSILDAAMLSPLPVSQLDRLIRLASPGITQPGEDTADEREAFSYPLYVDLRKAAGDSVQLALAGYVNGVDAIGLENAAIEKLNQAYESADFIQMLGVSAALGRVLSPDDDRAPGSRLWWSSATTIGGGDSTGIRTSLASVFTLTPTARLGVGVTRLWESRKRAFSEWSRESLSMCGCRRCCLIKKLSQARTGAGFALLAAWLRGYRRGKCKRACSRRFIAISWRLFSACLLCPRRLKHSSAARASACTQQTTGFRIFAEISPSHCGLCLL